MTTETGAVYYLTDPRNGQPRYVGSSVDPERRLSQHISQTHNNRVREWIDELESEGLMPQIQIVARDVPKSELRDTEHEILFSLAEEIDVFNELSATVYPSENDYRPADEQICRVLRDGRNLATNIADDTDLSRQYVSDRLGELAEAGHIENIGSGLYELVEEPTWSEVLGDDD